MQIQYLPGASAAVCSIVVAVVVTLLFHDVSEATHPDKMEERSTVSTYSPPDKLIPPVQGRNNWPRLVDSRRGLWAMHSKVRVKCLKPKLIKLIGKIERKFGKKVVITSGYRSKAYNRRVRGAKRSKHLTCEAADISIAGVSKYTLAKYVRSLPGRGGVGTYCRSGFVHIDIGKKRDWHWRCRKRKRKRKSA